MSEIAILRDQFNAFRNQTVAQIEALKAELETARQQALIAELWVNALVATHHDTASARKVAGEFKARLESARGKLPPAAASAFSALDTTAASIPSLK